MNAADDLLQNKLAPQIVTPRKTTYLACPSISRGRGRGARERASEPAMLTQMVSPTRPAPPPPISRMPHRQQPIRDENLRRQEDAEEDDEEYQDPASRIWAKIRRASGLSINPRRRNPSNSTTASVAASVSLPFSSACSADSRALRRRKGAVDGGNALRMERQRPAAMSSKTSLTDRTNLVVMEDSLASSKGRSPKGGGSGKGRRGSGRWGGFGGWFV